MIAFRDISALVSVDEVGIHTARVGPFVLKTTFLPVYRRGPDALGLAALVGGARFQLAGEPVGAAALDQLPTEDRLRAIELGRLLVVLNRSNTGAGAVPVIMPAGDGGDNGFASLGAIFDASSEGMDLVDALPARLICELPSPETAGLENLARQAAECRRRDIGVALRGFAGSPAAIEAVRAIRPELVSIDSRWFQHVTSMAQAARLLPGLFRSLRMAGADAHVGGVDGSTRLSSALAAEADMLSGAALAEPKLAGSYLEPVSVPMERLRHPGLNVVPLFG